MFKNKKASGFLSEHIVFIILNVVFFSVMVLFIYIQGNSVHLLEEETAKQVALLVDVAKPGTEIQLNLKELFDRARKDNLDKRDAFKIDKNRNVVIIKGSEKSFYEYSYFNDIDIIYEFGDEVEGVVEVVADVVILKFSEKKNKVISGEEGNKGVNEE